MDYPSNGRLRRTVYLANNPLSLLGLFVVICGAVTWLVTVVTQFGSRNPYLATLTVLALPALTIAGAALVVYGIRRRERRDLAPGVLPATFPPLTWDYPVVRRLTAFLLMALGANIIFGAFFTYSAVNYVASPMFCADSCHLLTPEFTALQYAPHADFDCTDCHVGGGAGSFVTAQMHGAENLIKAMTDSYSPPISTPIESFAQGQLPCLRCHPNRDYGEKYKDWVSFDDDEGNSATRTEMLLRIGGGDNHSGAHGAHLAGGVAIDYRSDPKRNTIPWIEYTAPDGTKTIYQTPAWEPAMADQFELRRMDCVDCHNRIAHSFETASKAIDGAMAKNAIDPRLPFIKRESLAVLQAAYSSREEAAERIPAALYDFYRKEFSEIAASEVGAILDASSTLLTIYQRNIWPAYGLTWGTHVNHGGHEDYPGCFRCHNDSHVSQDTARKPIGDNCSACHSILSDGEPISLPFAPELSLTSSRSSLPKGISFETRAGTADFDHAQHLEYEKGRCIACHNALFPMSRAELDYANDIHRTAEASKLSCAGCHVEGGNAFASANNCEKCHTDLSPKRQAAGQRPQLPSPLPEKLFYETSLGAVPFDHPLHVDEAEGRCVDCHNVLFAMEPAKLDYAADLHRTAEVARTSCAGCHAVGGEAFAAAENCAKCHTGIGEPKATPVSGISGIPALPSVETRLGAARFDHQKHVDEAGGECQTCHNKIFPLEKGLLNYKDNLHKTAEQSQTSCGACHHADGQAFEAKGNCLKCHTEPSTQVRGSELGLLEKTLFKNRLGDVAFSHDKHIVEADGGCKACHDRIWPMGKVELETYAQDYHRVAEAAEASCAACHAPTQQAFASLYNCVRCHEGLNPEVGWLRDAVPPLSNSGFASKSASPQT